MTPMDPALRQLIGVLQNLCTCDDGPHLCLYCDARQWLEAQQRTIDLAQEQIAHLGRIKNERLTWAIICDHDCTACDDLDATIRGVSITSGTP